MQRLRAEIVHGEVAPGAKLKLVPLARRYEVSRGPLREAASRLAAEGLLTFEDQRGFTVRAISRDDLLDVTRTRQRIEVLALRDAIEAGDLSWEGRVMSAVHVVERVTSRDGSGQRTEAYVMHHRAFHEALVSACPSVYLLDFRERLFALTERYRNLAAHDKVHGAKRDIAAEHRALAEAAVARDTSRACELLEAHLMTTATLLIDRYPEYFASP